LSHALNIRATVRLASSELDCKIETVNYVVAHLGGGISIAAVEREDIDANNANEQGHSVLKGPENYLPGKLRKWRFQATSQKVGS